MAAVGAASGDRLRTHAFSTTSNTAQASYCVWLHGFCVWLHGFCVWLHGYCVWLLGFCVWLLPADRAQAWRWHSLRLLPACCL